MKFLCSNCKAKYQIADEKVAGRTLRMTCRRCQEEIVIRGDGALPHALRGSVVPSGRLSLLSSAVPSPAGADYVPIAAGGRPSALSIPVVDEWHVAINDVPVGPIRREDIALKLAVGTITMESLAWREGLPDWQPIHTIPELAALSLPSSSIPPPPVPPPLRAPPRVEPSPVPPAAPARQSAVPQYGEPWAAQPERASQVALDPLLSGDRRNLPSWPAMFAMACGFAFLMSALAIFGANWLKESSATEQKASAPAPSAGASAPQPAQPVLEVPDEVPGDEGAPEMVIGTDDPALQDNARAGNKPRSGAGTTQTAKAPKKELTAEQKAMLARMQGDTGSGLAKLDTGSSGLSRPRATGTLSSEDVSKVVLQGRKNLQRCYETALRGTGSTETVRLDVELIVSPSGNVSSVKTSGGGLPGMAQCIQRTVKAWRFPASAESSPVKFPLLFQPGA